MHGTPCTELGSSKHGPCKFFGCQPPTFKGKSRMLRVKKICSQPYLKFQARILDAQSMVATKFFAFSLLLSIPKVGNQDKTKLILAMHKTLNTKLKNSKHGQGNFFALYRLLSTLKVGDQKQKHCSQPCPYLHGKN